MKRLLMASALLIITMLAACSKTGQESSEAAVTMESFALDTICTQQVWGGSAQQACDEVAAMLQHITNTMSMNEGSYIYAVNEAAPAAAQVSDEAAEVLSAALDIAKETDGAFNPAIGALTSLWDITGNPRVPSQGEIDNVFKKIDYTKVKLEGKSVSLGESGMKLDLGAIAKGYAADLAVRIYKKHGVKSALVNLGGNIYAYGKRIDGKDFRIGLRDPLGNAGETAVIVSVSGTSVVTSGVYERYFESGGVRYHHLFDPETGYPANNGLLSVSVVCKSSTRADGLSTALFVMGLQKGLKFAQEKDDIEAVFITEDKKIYITDGLKDSIEITNETYTLES